MYKFQKTAALLLLLWLFPLQVTAQTLYTTQVKVIQAGTGSAYIDPGIKDLIQEIKPVFTYTAYQLITEKEMKLQENQTGTMALGDNRILEITPLSLDNLRIKYQMRMEKEKRPLFQTQVLLQNGSSITIGGPKYQNGVLLINIRGSAH